MKYEIKLPAISGDIVPLCMVADAKAHARATAGGTPFHRPTFNRSLSGFADDLLREAELGRLQVCNAWGTPGDVDALIEKAACEGTLMEARSYVQEPDWERLHRENLPVAPGVWDLTHLDLGPTIPDMTSTRSSALYTHLKALNEWAATRGDEFTISHGGVEWVDERGLLTGDALKPMRPLRRIKKSTLDDDNIIAAIKRREIDPLRMPKPPLGNKAWPLRVEIGKELEITPVQMKRAFTRLRKDPARIKQL